MKPSIWYTLTRLFSGSVNHRSTARGLSPPQAQAKAGDEIVVATERPSQTCATSASNTTVLRTNDKSAGVDSANSTAAGPPGYCSLLLPDSVSFIELLKEPLVPSDIVIFSGGDSLKRRIKGFSESSADSLMKFADHHGYHLAFLDELDYDKRLIFRGIQFAPQWHKPFALPALRKKFPNSKYIVWIDDDILVPYPETFMLNHYINMMETDPDVHILVGDDIDTQVLNAGMYFMKNTEFSSWVMDEILAIGLENNGHLATHVFHEQGSMVELRKRHKLERKLRVISHRDGRYNFNTFIGERRNLAREGDAFVHFVNLKADQRAKKMSRMVETIAKWRESVPKTCTYPVNINKP